VLKLVIFKDSIKLLHIVFTLIDQVFLLSYI